MSNCFGRKIDMAKKKDVNIDELDDESERVESW